MATKKKTTSKPTPVEENPFEDLAAELAAPVEEKADADKPVETGEPETPAKDEAPAAGPDELTEKTEPELPAEETTSKRRTKAQILADDIEAAKSLLSENGYTVTHAGDESDAKGTDEDDSEVDFGGVVAEKTVITALSGQITGTVDQNMVSVPILRVSQVGWVGQAPLEVPASGISDIRAVLNDLEKQAREFSKK